MHNCFKFVLMSDFDSSFDYPQLLQICSEVDMIVCSHLESHSSSDQNVIPPSLSLQIPLFNELAHSQGNATFIAQK